MILPLGFLLFILSNFLVIIGAFGYNNPNFNFNIMMKIYLARNNVQAGPYTLDELNRMLSSGEVVLDDLMWHTGMSEWKTVGEMTYGRLNYQPTQNITPPSSVNLSKPQEKHGFGDNVDLRKDEKRVSVAELYGRKPTQETSSPQSTTVVITKNTQKDDGKIEYASIFARFTAFGINVALYMLALMPLVMAFMQVVDMNEIAKHAQDYVALQAYGQSLAEKIPTTTVAMSNMMFFALIGIQLLLIIMRGQSFGKMVMGIRVVDEKTGKLPSFGTLVFMRTLFLVLIYAIGTSLMSGLPAIIMLFTNYLMAKGNDKKQGWHDKMTRTLIVKAKPSQLDKTKK